MPEFDVAAPIVVTAQAANQWQQGAYEVWLLSGGCLLQQGQGYVRSREAVLWIDRASVFERRPNRVIAYFEGNVQVVAGRRAGAASLRASDWLGRLSSAGAVQVRAAAVAGKPNVLPPVYWRALDHRKPADTPEPWHSRVEAAQYATLAGPAAAGAAGRGASPAPAPLPPLPLLPQNTVNVPRPAPPAPPTAKIKPAGPSQSAPAGGLRRIRVFSRSDVPVQFQWFSDPTGHEWIAVIDSGVNVLVDGLAVPGVGPLGTLDISADRLVIWTTATQQPDLYRGTRQDERTPLEFYMEGNIIFRQGERVINADRMYYDVPNHLGTILNADVFTPVRSFQGLLRLHAEIVQQTGQDHYFAHNGFLTSSRLGEPSYRLQAGDIYFEDIQRPVIDPATGQPVRDAARDQPVVDHQRLATAANDVLYLGPVPVFYWPTITTDLNDSTYYIRHAELNQDSVFGTQIRTHWNGYDLLGIRNKPVGTDLDVDLDYLSLRGLGYGASFTYDRNDIFGLNERTAGLLTFWGIQDHGLDVLGDTRTAVEPESSYRGRLLWQHRQLLPWDMQLSAEAGWISDRNFLEEYYKSEWDQLKDQTTDVELKQAEENWSWSVFAQGRVDDFFTETEWLPRLDHDWLGQPLLNNVFTWYEHSSAGYANFQRLTPPQDPITDGPFNFLPWEVGNRQGSRFASRQELDYPFQLGPVKVVPFVMGEAAYWGEDINGQPLNRLWGETGLRATLPMWSVDPTANSDFFNVHGLAHKVLWTAEFTTSQANQDLTSLPLYDLLDDASVLAWRRMFLTTTFGLPNDVLLPNGLPYLPKFDERFYALRSGLQDWVTSPSTEIAGDLTALRLGAEQRWQTKRGPADDPHIIDWITLDTDVTVFPDPIRDDFGSAVGLANYNFVWHAGDRLTFLSSGLFDFFDQGQKIVSVGGFLDRPPRGSLYAGLDFLEGPMDHQILTVSYSYRMSPKWMSTLGTTYDFGSDGNLGEFFNITRIGESFLVTAGFNVDVSRGVVGATVLVEPRFMPWNRLGNLTGAQVPPAGIVGLE